MTEGQGLAAFVLLGAAIVAASIYCSGRKIAKSNEKLARVHNEIMQFLVTRNNIETTTALEDPGLAGKVEAK